MHVLWGFCTLHTCKKCKHLVADSACQLQAASQHMAGLLQTCTIASIALLCCHIVQKSSLSICRRAMYLCTRTRHVCMHVAGRCTNARAAAVDPRYPVCRGPGHQPPLPCCHHCAPPSNHRGKLPMLTCALNTAQGHCSRDVIMSLCQHGSNSITMLVLHQNSFACSTG